MKEQIKKVKTGLNKVVSSYKKYSMPTHKIYDKVEKTIYKESDNKKKK